MKILFITHHQLDLFGGGAIASKALANAFAEISDCITLLYPTEKDITQLRDINPKTNLIPITNEGSIICKIFRLLSGQISRYQKIAPYYLSSGNFDTVVFDNSKTSFRLVKRAKREGLKTITIHHNFEYEFARGNYSGLLKYIMLFWSRKFEKQACRYSDLNITLTPQDSESLAKAFTNGDGSRFVSLGIFEPTINNLPTLKKGNNSDPKQMTFAITGNLSISQTVHSLVPWIKDYYPELRKSFRNCHLIIAGSNPDQSIVKLSRQNGIELVDSPATMDSILERADCYICPASLGGGIKLRIMDGLRWGLPVITHNVSARGYDFFISKGVIFDYDSIASFKESLLSVKQMHFSKEDIRAMYCENFSYERGVQRLRKILNNYGIC